MSSDLLFSGFSGRARSQAFSITSEDGRSIDTGTEDYFVDEGPSFFCTSRHERSSETGLISYPTNKDAITSEEADSWKMKERMKTVSVLLTFCLNIGVDPPDVVKTQPCARLECWIDPNAQPPAKSLEAIGKALQDQYEKWHPKAKYKVCPDPTIDDLKKTCTSLRKSALNERVLFHYNGHGVPKPTPAGEIWVFNKNFTQYIPLPVYDLQSWMGSPSIFVYDCSAAGYIVASFNKYAEQRERESLRIPNPQFVQSMKDCIQFAACKSNQVLPMNPDLPADMFTSCLTTPIEIAVRWFVLQNSVLTNMSLDIVSKIPGRSNDRKTPLGELNWIFTAITDTIAWDVLPKDMFQKLFRQDMMVAGLFRNFLLADRIMRSYGCTPISQPALPLTHNHPLWKSWDLAVDACLSQLHVIVDREDLYVHSTFFTEQLKAFEVWLQGRPSKSSKPPQQLPVILQVLLSQAHRLRALQLLVQFVDLGSWAVLQALSVGIFPYVLKLLQSPASELRRLLVHIWARIIPVDRSCQQDLIRDGGYKYFIHVLWTTAVKSDERAMAAFVLSLICHNSKEGKEACLKAATISNCLAHLADVDPILRQWLCLCLGELWYDYSEAKSAAIRESAHEKLQTLLTDQCPEVRAAAVYVLSKFLGEIEKTPEIMSVENSIIISLIIVTSDSSPLVRKELVIALSKFVYSNEAEFRVTALEQWEEELRKNVSPEIKDRKSSNPITTRSSKDKSNAATSVNQCIWKVLLSLSVDPFPDVAELAQTVVDNVNKTFVTPQFFDATPVSKKSSASFKIMPDAPPKTPMSPKPRQKMSNASMKPFLKLPLISTFFEWSIEQYSRPGDQWCEIDCPDPTTEEKMWRSNRLQYIIKESRPSQRKGGQKKVDEQISFLENESEIISHLEFHPYEPYLYVVDERETISIWDIEESKRVNIFSNLNPFGSRITSMKLINAGYKGMVMVGSDEGVIRIWQDCEKEKFSMATSWRALTDLYPSQRGSGLVMDWQQKFGNVIVSGDVRVIRIWDTEREICVQDIPTQSDSCITSLTSDKINGNILIGSCGDGSVKVFDRRHPSRESLVKSLVEHKGWIIKCHLEQRPNGHLITSSVGEVKFWDLRQDHSVSTYETPNSTSFASHEHAPIFASGSLHQFIKVFNFNGDLLNTIRYHDGFLGQRIGPVSCMAFHPHKTVLAAGSTDAVVSVFANETKM